MLFAVLGLMFLALAWFPQWWVKRTLSKHNKHRSDLDGTGGELALHLIKRFELEGVSVIKGRPGEDFYDPDTLTVSLSPDNYDGQSLSAVAVATHEVSHALQHKQRDKGFILRKRRVQTAMRIERFSAIAMIATPLLTLLTRVPHTGLITLALGLSGMLAASWVQLLTLPVEMDASFNRALPILKQGYLKHEDIPAVQDVLKAAALTYVAATLASLLNVGRWIAILRR